MIFFTAKRSFRQKFSGREAGGNTSAETNSPAADMGKPMLAKMGNIA